MTGLYSSEMPKEKASVLHFLNVMMALGLGMKMSLSFKKCTVKYSSWRLTLKWLSKKLLK